MIWLYIDKQIPSSPVRQSSWREWFGLGRGWAPRSRRWRANGWRKKRWRQTMPRTPVYKNQYMTANVWDDRLCIPFLIYTYIEILRGNKETNSEPPGCVSTISGWPSRQSQPTAESSPRHWCVPGNITMRWRNSLSRMKRWWRLNGQTSTGNVTPLRWMTFSWNVKFVPMWDHIYAYINIYIYIIMYERQSCYLKHSETVLYIFITNIYIYKWHTLLLSQLSCCQLTKDIRSENAPKGPDALDAMGDEDTPAPEALGEQVPRQKNSGSASPCEYIYKSIYQCPIVRSIPM